MTEQASRCAADARSHDHERDRQGRTLHSRNLLEA